MLDKTGPRFTNLGVVGASGALGPAVRIRCEAMVQLLLVEDDDSIRGALIRALTEYGHGVTSAGTAADALSSIESTRPDLVLLDNSISEEEASWKNIDSVMDVHW